MKSVLRIERGSFVLNNVFRYYDYDKIQRDLLRNEEKGYFEVSFSSFLSIKAGVCEEIS
jgi:hypothetical protein